jgi:hypothetical protein
MVSGCTWHCSNMHEFYGLGTNPQGRLLFTFGTAIAICCSMMTNRQSLPQNQQRKAAAFAGTLQALAKLAIVGLFLATPALAQEQLQSQNKNSVEPTAEVFPSALEQAKTSESALPRGIIPVKTAGKFAGSPFQTEYREHKFWDRTNIILQGAGGAAAAVDYWSTRRLLTGDGYEANPIVQPFANSAAGLAAFKAGSWGASLGISYLLHRSGHHKLERLIPAFNIVMNGAAATHNLRLGSTNSLGAVNIRVR